MRGACVGEERQKCEIGSERRGREMGKWVNGQGNRGGGGEGTMGIVLLIARKMLLAAVYVRTYLSIFECVSQFSCFAFVATLHPPLSGPQNPEDGHTLTWTGTWNEKWRLMTPVSVSFCGIS